MQQSQQWIKQAMILFINPKDKSRVDQELVNVSQQIFNSINLNHVVQPNEAFKPFHIVLLGRHSDSIEVALDTLSKLFNLEFFKEESLLTLIVETVCNIFDGPESTEDRLQLQVIKCLASCICSPDSIHGSLLLKAIRLVYNIFLLSKSSQIQTVAQASLSQIGHIIFTKLQPITFDEVMKYHPDRLGTKVERNADIQRSQSMESISQDPFDGVKQLGEKDPLARDSQEILAIDKVQSQHDINCKDAYLVFRAFCKLAMKPITAVEVVTDLKSHAMRSKLLSMYLVQMTLKTCPWILTCPAPILFSPAIKISSADDILLLYAVRQFLCLTFTRNICSVIPQVISLALDIFGQILSVRHLLVKEISIMFCDIIIPMLEHKTVVTFHQRLELVKSLERIFKVMPQLSIELYLNYDCSQTEENIWEKIISSLSTIITSSIPSDQSESNVSNDRITGAAPWITSSTLETFSNSQIKEIYSATGDLKLLKKHTLMFLVLGILQPLVDWSHEPPVEKKTEEEDDDQQSLQFLKLKKQDLQEGIKRFNIKYKKGMKWLIESGCIPSDNPDDIAFFLLNTEGLNKTHIGEYLGEGEAENIKVMHSFVDLFDFSGLTFVDALRSFLQAFRLPGEAQKIDRFMLKFASRYCEGNPNAFSTADTAYVLAYSVIMLNTDQHNAQVKKRMTRNEFVKNNRGIDQGEDIPVQYLEAIFDEISTNEIILNDEKPAIENKTQHQRKQTKHTEGDHSNEPIDKLIRKNFGATKDPTSMDSKFSKLTKVAFHSSSQRESLKYMFQVTWMSVLMSLSSFLQNFDDKEALHITLQGFKCAIHICCKFDLEMERKGFLSNLSKFAQLETLSSKNVEACKMLIEIAHIDGDFLQSDWQTVMKIISQIDKITQTPLRERDPKLSGVELKKRIDYEECHEALTNQSMMLLIDRIFSQSNKLKNGIYDFVRALCDQSWDEIISSSDKATPRMYCLQRIVEIAYYNMKRIRVEWSKIWQILSPHLIMVVTHQNSNIGYFALDKMRQLSLKFLELEELSNFSFQKEFLVPFYVAIQENTSLKIKDMSLTCLYQIIQAKPKSIKSGWKTIFLALLSACQDQKEEIVSLALTTLRTIQTTALSWVVKNHCTVEYVASCVALARNSTFPKLANQSLGLLVDGISKCKDLDDDWSIGFNNLLSIYFPQFTLDVKEIPQVQVYLPFYVGLYQMVVDCDIEIRTKALEAMFENLPKDPELVKILFLSAIDPIFSKLRDHSLIENVEDHSMWVSTTLIQTLRSLVEILSRDFSAFKFLFSNYLDILAVCMIQDNEALCRVGSDCIVEIVQRNVDSFDENTWDMIIDKLTDLAQVTLPHGLYFDVEEKGGQTDFGHGFASKPQRKDFQGLIVKCVLHLIVLDTYTAILTGEKQNQVYNSFATRHLIRICDSVYFSYQFAKSFNKNLALRRELQKMGFMRNVPNLLKQETISLSCYICILGKIYNDQTRSFMNDKIENLLIPLLYEISQGYQLIPRSKEKLLMQWEGVMQQIISLLSDLNDEKFKKHIPLFYPACCLLISSSTPGLLENLTCLFQRVGKVWVPMAETINEQNVSFRDVMDEIRKSCVKSPDDEAGTGDETIPKNE